MDLFKRLLVAALTLSSAGLSYAEMKVSDNNTKITFIAVNGGG